jgi:glycosidase
MKNWQRDSIVYQIFPDRFKIGNGKNVFQKREQGHYQLPKQDVRDWGEKPVASVDGSHQYDFWGGDLAGITEELDYIRDLGANTLYLNPIFWGHTNHKYDTVDYFKIDPDFGTEEEFLLLVETAHSKGLSIILDGVFNHVGASGKWANSLELFEEPGALQGNEEFRKYFFEGKKGLRGWMDSCNLLELNLENPILSNMVFRGTDSVVAHWLKKGIDGWRLDVAYDLGPRILKEIVATTKSIRSGAVVIGEIWNYPGGWPEQSHLDGLMNYYFRLVIWEALNGYLSGHDALKIIDEAIREAGLTFISNSWTILSSHDVPRLKNELGSFQRVKAALVLQYCLPGIPLIYYGEEIEMDGGNDPENRAPMDWQSVSKETETRILYKKLNAIRETKASLRAGNFKPLISSDSSLISFKRTGEIVDDMVLCVVNPTANNVESRVFLQEGFLMNGTEMKDLLTGRAFRVSFGTVSVDLGPFEALIMEPLIFRSDLHYSPYKRL